MSIALLDATVFLENELGNPAPDVRSKVESVMKDPNIILLDRTEEGNVVDKAILAMVRHAGFTDIDAAAKEKLRKLAIQRIKHFAKQFCFASQRQKQLKLVPYRSPLVWVLALNEPFNVLELKKWYDETYRNRFEAIKSEWKTIIEESDGVAEGSTLRAEED